jgi:hypothetical protein
MKIVARMAIIVAVLASGPAAEAAKNNYSAHRPAIAGFAAWIETEMVALARMNGLMSFLAGSHWPARLMEPTVLSS